jgi:transposase
MGLVPRQHSSGGKNNLGGTSGVQGPLPLKAKRGDNYLRSLLIQGAKSAVMSAHKRSDPISVWVSGLKERLGWQKAVALANKNARILCAVMTKGDAFNAKHVSFKPAITTSNTPAFASA